MSRSTLALAAAVAAIGLVAATSAHAATYSKAYNANAATPAAEPSDTVANGGGGWTLGGVGPTSVARGPGADAGGNYWQVNDTNTSTISGNPSNNSVAYSVAGTGTGSDPALAALFADPDASWKFSTTIKVAGATHGSAGAGTSPIFMDVRTSPNGAANSGRIFTIGLFKGDDTNQDGVWFASNGSAASTLIRGMDLGDTFHTIDMVLNRSAADPSSNTFTVAIDGVTYYTLAETAANTSTASRAQIGSAASGATSTYQMRYLSFSSPIPEPTSLAAVGLVAAGAGVRRRRRRDA